MLWILRFIAVLVFCTGSLTSSAEEFAVGGTIVFPETGPLVVALITEQEFYARALNPDNPYVLTIEPGSQQSDRHQATFMFRHVRAGRYTVGCFQDVNGNHQLDTNIFGIPTEPWGVYQLKYSLLHAPDFMEVAFPVPGGTTGLEILMK